MRIYITTEGKPENSLKKIQFTSESKYYNCQLKTPSNIEHPEITLDEFIPDARYAYIPLFERYYFIENITAIHNEIFSYSLTIDVLGTYSADIKKLSLYAKRSSAGATLRLSDPYLSHENRVNCITTTGTYGSDAPAMDFNTGIYVLQTVGGGASSAHGSNLVYIVDGSTLQDLMDELFNASSSIYGDDIADDVVKTYFNPFQYIVSCMWFPFGSLGTGSDNIKFGFWESSYQGLLYNSFGIYKSFSVAIPSIGSGATDCNPNWTRHTLFVPGFGQIPIDSHFSGRTLLGSIRVDIITGIANLELSVSTGTGANQYAVIATVSGQWGIPIALSQLSVDSSNIGTTVFASLDTMLEGAITNAYAGKGAEGDIWSAAAMGVISKFASKVPILGSLIPDAQEAMQPTLAMCGTNGNRFYIKEHNTINLYTTYYNSNNINDIHTKFNWPDNRVRKVSDLTGYAVFVPEKAISFGNSTENALITSFLEGGVIVE